MLPILRRLLLQLQDMVNEALDSQALGPQQSSGSATVSGLGQSEGSSGLPRPVGDGSADRPCQPVSRALLGDFQASAAEPTVTGRSRRQGAKREQQAKAKSSAEPTQAQLRKIKALLQQMPEGQRSG